VPCDVADVSQRQRQLIWICVVFCLLVALDQVTKSIVRQRIPLDSVTRVGHEEDFFYFVHQANPGLVFGSFRNNRVIAVAAPVLAMLVLVYLYRHLDVASKLQAVAYGLVAGGAVGNQIDRCLRGSVTDFLQFHFYFIKFNFPGKLYPAFNVADSAICTGVVLLVLCWHGHGQEDDAADTD